METLLGRSFTGPELAGAAGLTYRRVDYYTRVGLLHPDVRGFAGPGSRRVYREDDLPRVRLIGHLLDLGATIPVVARALEQLAPNPGDWPPYFFVTPAGDLRRGLPLPPVAWWVASGPLLEPAPESAAA